MGYYDDTEIKPTLRETLDRGAQHDLDDRIARRDTIERAVSNRSSVEHIQKQADDKRAQAAEAAGFEEQRRFMKFGRTDTADVSNLRPGGKKSVRESIYAAMHEHNMPRVVVDSFDPITGALKTKIEEPKTYQPPPGMNVHRKEFEALPQHIREIHHDTAKEAAEFTQARNALANPQSAAAYLAALVQRFPLSQADLQNGAKWLHDPKRQNVRRPLPDGALPPGWTKQDWAAATTGVRAAARQQHEQVFTLREANKLMQDPSTRLQAWKMLASEYNHVDQFLRQTTGTMPQAVVSQQYSQAERFVNDWARDKRYFNTQVPDGMGGKTTVKKLMGEVMRQPHFNAAAYANDPMRAMTDVYNAVVSHFGFGVGEKRVPQRRSSTSMSGSAPDVSHTTLPSHAPLRTDTARESALKAIAELRGR